MAPKSEDPQAALEQAKRDIIEQAKAAGVIQAREISQKSLISRRMLPYSMRFIQN